MREEKKEKGRWYYPWRKTDYLVERIARIVKENVSLVRQWISEGVIVTK